MVPCGMVVRMVAATSPAEAEACCHGYIYDTRTSRGL